MDYDDLVSEEKLKREPKIGLDQVERLLNRSGKDMSTARKLIKSDAPAAMAFVYDAMFHAANALIRMQGYRPGERKQHIGVIEAVRRTLGEDAKNFILKFDDLRVQRNRFEYSAIFNMSDAQLEKAMEDAGKLVEEIGKYVQSKHPQKHFNWGE